MATSPLFISKFRLIFVIGWICLMALQFLLIYRSGFSFIIALTDSLICNLLLALSTILVSNNLRYYLPGNEKQWYILVLCAGIAGLWLFISNQILKHLPFNDSTYPGFLTNSLPVRLIIAMLIITGIAVISMLWYTVEDQKQSEQRKADVEKLSREAELYKLRHQLQPHFLFNSLNSINALIGAQPEEARRMVQQLSDFLRGTLKKEENEWISFEEELNYLQLYLEIEKVRFGHRLSTVVEQDKECGPMKLPALLLQPIVENAIKFGLYDTTEPITISISARKKENELILLVQNPFDPETAQPRQGTGFGLNSVRRRLQLLFERTDLLKTYTEDHHFITQVTVPQI